MVYARKLSVVNTIALYYQMSHNDLHYEPCGSVIHRHLRTDNGTAFCLCPYHVVQRAYSSIPYLSEINRDQRPAEKIKQKKKEG